MDKQPTIQELSQYARTADWNRLGVALKLDSVALAGCRDYTDMYQLWIMEKAREATRRNLLNALYALKLKAIVQKYEDYLKKLVELLFTHIWPHVQRILPSVSLFCIYIISLYVN